MILPLISILSIIFTNVNEVLVAFTTLDFFNRNRISSTYAFSPHDISATQIKDYVHLLDGFVELHLHLPELVQTKLPQIDFSVLPQLGSTIHLPDGFEKFVKTFQTIYSPVNAPELFTIESFIRLYTLSYQDNVAARVFKINNNIS